MTTQTLTEKLRILADAAEAREAMVHASCSSISGPYPLDSAVLHIHKFNTISRIPKPNKQIKVGQRWINAPLRKMPEEGEYWWLDFFGNPSPILVSQSQYSSVKLFKAGNIWATKEDAIAWHEASLALRKGGAA